MLRPTDMRRRVPASVLVEGEEGNCLGAEAAEERMPLVSAAAAAASLRELPGILCLERLLLLLLLLLLLQQVEP